MKTFSKKIAAIVMLAVMSLSAFCLGFVAMFSTAPAIAETTFTHDNLTLVKIEDAVTSMSSVTFSNKGTVVYSKSTNTDKLNTLVESDFNWGLYTKAAANSDIDGDYKTNVNTYDGNISAYMSNTNNRYVHFSFLNSTSFRGKAYAFKTVYNSSYDMTVLLATAANTNEAGSKVVLSQGNTYNADPHIEFHGYSKYIKDTATKYSYANLLATLNEGRLTKMKVYLSTETF